MDELVTAFLDDLALGRGRAANTIVAYRRNLQQFTAFAEEHAWTESRTALAPLALQRYAGHLRQRGLSAASIQQKIASLRSFAAYLRECHPDRAPPAGQARIRYRRQRRVRTTLSTAQLRTLLVHLLQKVDTARENGGRLLASRDLALFSLLAGTGIRVGEAVDIVLADLDLLHGHIRIRGKGGHERIVFCDIDEIRLPLEQYLACRGHIDGVKTDHVFVNGRDLGRLSPRAVQLRIRSLCAQLDLPTDLTPHGLRHTYATLAIERGANIKAVSQLLGHNDIRVTLQMYTTPTCPPTTSARSSGSAIRYETTNSTCPRSSTIGRR